MKLCSLLTFLVSGHLATAVNLTGSMCIWLFKIISYTYLTLDRNNSHFSGLSHRLWLLKISKISATACSWLQPSLLEAMKPAAYYPKFEDPRWSPTPASRKSDTLICRVNQGQNLACIGRLGSDPKLHQTPESEVIMLAVWCKLGKFPYPSLSY